MLLCIRLSEGDLKWERLIQRINCGWTLNQVGSLRAWVLAVVLLRAHQGLSLSPSSHKAWWHLVPKQHTTTQHTSPKTRHFRFTWPWVGAEVSPIFLHLARTHKGFALTFPEICSNSARNCFSSSFSCGLGVGFRGCNINHTSHCKNCKTWHFSCM